MKTNTMSRNSPTTWLPRAYEGSVLTENTVTAGYDLETTIYIFVSPERHHMPKDRNEASRCHTLLDGWQKRRHSDRSVILMELRMSN